MDINNKVSEILSVLLEKEIKNNEDVSMDTEDNWDSLKHIEIIMTIEEEMDISFPPEVIPKLRSKSKIIDKINELK